MVKVNSEWSFGLSMDETGVSLCFGDDGPYIPIDEMTQVQAQEAAKLLAEGMRGFQCIAQLSQEKLRQAPSTKQAQLVVSWRTWACCLLASNGTVSAFWLSQAFALNRAFKPIFFAVSLGLLCASLIASLPGMIAMRRFSRGT